MPATTSPVRRAVRLLDVSDLSKAYPLELLADFATGDFTLVKSDGNTIIHKKPGSITVKQGNQTLLENGDLSSNLSLTIPEFPKINTMTGATDSNPGTSGLVPGPAAGDHNSFLRGDGTWVVIRSVEHANNADAATKLKAPVNFTIGDASAKGFDGSANLSWTLEEIGASKSDHNHDAAYLKLSGGTITGLISPNADNVIDLGTSALKFRNIYANSFYGNASSATKLAAARSFALSGVKSTSVNFDGSADVNVQVTEVPANLLTGTIDIARLPAGSLDRLIHVENEAARLALTTAQVQLGDTVQQDDTGILYYVVDESKLNTNEGYTEYTAARASSVPWSGVTEKPTIYGPSDTIPLVASGTGNAGVGNTFARADHVHPIQQTVAKLATARTFTIGSAPAKGFDGSTNLSWTLEEIGAAKANHTHGATDFVIDKANHATTADKFKTPVNVAIGNAIKEFDGSASLSYTLTEIGAAEANHTHTAYENKNAFGIISDGGTNSIASGSPTDTLVIAASNIGLAFDAVAKKITLSVSKASTTVAGIVQLNDATNSTAVDQAATANAVKKAYDLANGKRSPITGAVDQFVGFGDNGAEIAKNFPVAGSALGMIKTGYSANAKNYPVAVDAQGNAYVNVPWTDNNTTYGQATADVSGLVKIGYADNSKNYGVKLDASGKMYVSVPWTDNDTTYGQGTASALGLTKLYTGTGTAADGTMTQNAITSALNNKVNLNGATMTGNLSVPNFTARDSLTVSNKGNVAGISITYNATIGTSWSGSAAPYSQAITVNGIKASDVPVVDYAPSGNYTNDKKAEEAFMSSIHRIVTAANKITVYVHQKTTVNIPIKLLVVR